MYMLELDKRVNKSAIYNILQELINKYSFCKNIIIACIFKKSKILSYGISKPDIHVHSIKNNKLYSVHAEVDAIKNYINKYSKKERKQIGDVNMLITRYNKDCLLLSTQSCRYCIRSMNKFKSIKKLYYTKEDIIYESNFENMYKNIDKYDCSSGDRRNKKNNKIFINKSEN